MWRLTIQIHKSSGGVEGRLRADRSGAPLSNLGLGTNAPKILAITTVSASVTVDYNLQARKSCIGSPTINEPSHCDSLSKFLPSFDAVCDHLSALLLSCTTFRQNIFIVSS